MVRQQFSRLPSLRFLISQSLFLEVNAKRKERLAAYQSKDSHQTKYAHLLLQELANDLSFYSESQREVDRLLGEIHALRLEMVMHQTVSKLDQGIIREFARSKHLDEELTSFFIERLRPQTAIPVRETI